MNRTMTRDLHAGNNFRITGLKTNRRSGRNVKSIAIRLDPVKVKLRICLNEVVV